MISAELSEHVRVGSKYAGPGVSILAAAWDVAVADTGFQRCVAAAEGAASLGAGTLGGIVGSPADHLGLSSGRCSPPLAARLLVTGSETHFVHDEDLPEN